MTVGRRFETLVQSVASAVLSEKPSSEPKYKSLAAVDVSQRLLIRRAKKLIAQRKPAAQLRRCLCRGARPMLARKACAEFRKLRVLSKG